MECWWCGRVDQSVDHLYNKCRKWKIEKRMLKKELGKRRIGWQCQPENKWLANLLAIKQAVSPLLNYLMAINIESREGEREEVEEIDQIKNQESKALLDSR